MTLKTYKPARAKPAPRVEQSLATFSGRTATAVRPVKITSPRRTRAAQAGGPAVFEITEGDVPVATLRINRASESLGLWIELLTRMDSMMVTAVDVADALHAPTNAEPAPPSTAHAALESLRTRLSHQTRPAADAPRRAEVSEAIQHQWTSSGLLVGSGELAAAWGQRTRQALEQAVERGDLFSLKLRRRRWYPAVFQGLSADSVKSVCQAMKGVDPVSQFLFWNRPQGALAGQTLAQAIAAGQLPRAVQLAQAFADEHAADAAAV